MKTTLATLLATIMTMGLSTAVFAGEADPNAGQAPDAAPAQEEVPTDFSDSELEKFASVQNDLEEIRNDYSGRLEDTEDQDKAAELQQEASQKMVQVVQDAGLEVETYSNIALALQSDPELREKVEDMM